MAFNSVMVCVVPLMALVWSVLGRTVENAAVRWSRILVSVVLACPMGMLTKSPPPKYFLRAATRGGGELVGLLCVLFVALEVSGESSLYENEGA